MKIGGLTYRHFKQKVAHISVMSDTVLLKPLGEVSNPDCSNWKPHRILWNRPWFEDSDSEELY